MKFTKIDAPEKFVVFTDLRVGQFFTWPGASSTLIFLKDSEKSYKMITENNELTGYNYLGNSRVIPIEVVEIQYRLKQ